MREGRCYGCFLTSTFGGQVMKHGLMERFKAMEDVGRMWQRQARLGIAELQRADGRKLPRILSIFTRCNRITSQPMALFCLPTPTNLIRTDPSRLPNPPRKSGTARTANTKDQPVALGARGPERIGSPRSVVPSRVPLPRKMRTRLPAARMKGI